MRFLEGQSGPCRGAVLVAGFLLTIGDCTADEYLNGYPNPWFSTSHRDGEVSDKYNKSEQPETGFQHCSCEEGKKKIPDYLFLSHPFDDSHAELV